MTILVIEVVVGVSLLVLVAAAAAGRDRRREDTCDQCGARNPLQLTNCRTCGEVMWTHRDTQT